METNVAYSDSADILRVSPVPRDVCDSLQCQSAAPSTSTEACSHCAFLHGNGCVSTTHRAKIRRARANVCLKKYDDALRDFMDYAENHCHGAEYSDVKQEMNEVIRQRDKEAEEKERKRRQKKAQQEKKNRWKTKGPWRRCVSECVAPPGLLRSWRRECGLCAVWKSTLYRVRMLCCV